jgi:hypothetical protein
MTLTATPDPALLRPALEPGVNGATDLCLLPGADRGAGADDGRQPGTGTADIGRACAPRHTITEAPAARLRV